MRRGRHVRLGIGRVLVLLRVLNRVLLSREHAADIVLGVPRRPHVCRGACVDGVHHGVPRGLLLPPEHGNALMRGWEVQCRDRREYSRDVHELHFRGGLLLSPGKHVAGGRCVPERLLLHGRQRELGRSIMCGGRNPERRVRCTYWINVISCSMH